jgi:hypothetical protein
MTGARLRVRGPLRRAADHRGDPSTSLLALAPPFQPAEVLERQARQRRIRARRIRRPRRRREQRLDALVGLQEHEASRLHRRAQRGEFEVHQMRNLHVAQEIRVVVLVDVAQPGHADVQERSVGQQLADARHLGPRIGQMLENLLVDHEAGNGPLLGEDRRGVAEIPAAQVEPMRPGSVVDIGAAGVDAQDTVTALGERRQYPAGATPDL